MTNGFYLQNFLYLYSRNKHVIMENTRIKLSETVMVIDAAYLNFVINDLKKYFEPLLGRSLQRADLALFTMCLAMDAGVKEGSNDVQILLVYDEQSGKLEDCLPSDLKSELDGMAFKGPLGEFCFMAVNQGGRSKDNKAAKMTKEEREKKMAEMKKSREDYDAQLKKIMTKEQYDSYVKKQAEREKQMKEGRQNRQKRQG